MADSSIDPDLAIVIVTGILAVFYLALAIWNFSRQRIGMGAARLFAAALFGGVAFFLATFEMHLF